MTDRSNRVFRSRKIEHAAAAGILLVVAAAFAGVPADAGTPAQPQKPLDLCPSVPRGAHLTDSLHSSALIDAEDPADLPIVGVPQLEAMDSPVHVPQTGIGSLYWALRHPAQSWRIFIPAR